MPTSGWYCQGDGTAKWYCPEALRSLRLNIYLLIAGFPEVDRREQEAFPRSP
jgi:hypothetical protein